MKENFIKLTLGTIAAGLTAYFEKMLVPLAVLFGVMLMDYVSGMMKAYVKGELSSRVGIIGIIKKLSYLLITAAAMAFDWLICYTAGVCDLGLNCEPYFFCTLVAVWLIINEIISILENLISLGVPVPKFMEKAVLAAKNKIDSKEDK